MGDYNGWTNYETWCVKLWIDSDEGFYHESADVCRGASEYDAAKRLNDWVRELAPDLGGTMFGDLLGSALDSVNWQEIAAAIREDDEEEEA